MPLAMFVFLFGFILSGVGATIFAHGWVALRVGPKGIGAKEVKEFCLAWILALALGMVTTASVIGLAYMRDVDLRMTVG